MPVCVVDVGQDLKTILSRMRATLPCLREVFRWATIIVQVESNMGTPFAETLQMFAIHYAGIPAIPQNDPSRTGLHTSHNIKLMAYTEARSLLKHRKVGYTSMWFGQDECKTKEKFARQLKSMQQTCAYSDRTQLTTTKITGKGSHNADQDDIAISFMLQAYAILTYTEKQKNRQDGQLLNSVNKYQAILDATSTRAFSNVRLDLRRPAVRPQGRKVVHDQYGKRRSAQSRMQAIDALSGDHTVTKDVMDIIHSQVHV